MIKELEAGEACTCGRITQVLVNGVGQIGVVCWGHSAPRKVGRPSTRLSKVPILRGLVCPSWCTLPKNHEGGCRASKAVIAAVDPANATPSSWARAQARTQPKPLKAARTCACGELLLGRALKCVLCRKPARVRTDHYTYKPRECSGCQKLYQPSGPRGHECPACR